MSENDIRTDKLKILTPENYFAHTVQKKWFTFNVAFRKVGHSDFKICAIFRSKKCAIARIQKKFAILKIKKQFRDIKGISRVQKVRNFEN